MLLEPVVAIFPQRVQDRTKCTRKGQVKIGTRMLIEPDVSKRAHIEPDVGKGVGERVHCEPPVGRARVKGCTQKDTLETACS